MSEKQLHWCFYGKIHAGKSESCVGRVAYLENLNTTEKCFFLEGLRGIRKMYGLLLGLMLLFGCQFQRFR